MDLTECRAEIDRIDRKMVNLLQARMRVSEEVARYKMKHDLPVLDTKREKEKLESLSLLVDEDLEKYLKIVYNAILEVSKDHQISIINSKQ